MQELNVVDTSKRYLIESADWALNGQCLQDWCLIIYFLKFKIHRACCHMGREKGLTECHLI